MSEGSSIRLRVAAVVVVVAAAVAATMVVPPSSGRSVVTVARFGTRVALNRPGLLLSSLAVARRTTVPLEDGRAVIVAPVRLSLAGGAGVDAEIRLELEGSGVLPLDAAEVRSLGFQEAWSSWLGGRLAGEGAEAGEAIRRSDGWGRIFPDRGAEPPLDVTERFAADFSGTMLRRATLVARPDVELLRSAARQRLRELARPGGRLVLIGLDALDWRLLDELVGRGLMPNLARIVGRGAQAVEEVGPPLLSPLVWTTIATGVTPDIHGVLDFVEPDPDTGGPRPVSSFSRKAPALWEMVAAAGRSSAVIGWWATFPAAAPVGGTVYSDRLSEQLMGLESSLPGLADPPEADSAARHLVVRGSDVTPEMLSPMLSVSRAELDAVPPGEAAWGDPVGGLARIVAATLTVQRLTERELERGTEVVLAYIEGTDTVGHLFGPHRPPALSFVDPAAARRFGGVVDRYYAYIDRWLGTVAAKLGPDETLVIVSDHGFTWGDDRPRVAAGAHTPTAVYWHRPEGVFVAAGPRVEASPSRHRMNVLDVAPSLLALAGLPVGAEMPGSVPDWLLAAGSPPVTEKVGYAELVPVQEAARIELPPEAKAEELAKLRALGYLGGDDTGGGAGGGGPAAEAQSRAVDARLEGRRLHNLAISLVDAGKTVEAEARLRQAIDTWDAYAPSHYALAGLLRRQARYDESDAELWRAVQLGLGDPESALRRVAGEYRQIGQPGRAINVLETGLRRYPDSAEIMVDLGILHGEQRHFAEARATLERAVALLPGDAFAWRNLAAAQMATGDAVAARRSLTRALRLAPDDAQLRTQLERLGGPLD